MRCYVLCLVNKLCFLMWEGGGEGLIERGAYKKFDLQTRGLIVIREVLCFLFFFFFFFFFSRRTASTFLTKVAFRR